MSRCDSKESWGGVASVGALPWGLQHPKEPMWRLSSQGRLGCLKSGHGCPGGVELVLRLHQECPNVVKLVMELHHVSHAGNQGKFQDGGASVGFTMCVPVVTKGSS